MNTRIIVTIAAIVIAATVTLCGITFAQAPEAPQPPTMEQAVTQLETSVQALCATLDKIEMAPAKGAAIVQALQPVLRATQDLRKALPPTPAPEAPTVPAQPAQ